MDTMQTCDTIKPMEAIVETLRKRPSETLTLTQIAERKLIPWARDTRTIRKMIDADFEGANLMRAIVTGDGTQRRYLVTARGVIKYLQAYGPVLMATVRKTKTHDKEIGDIGKKRPGKGNRRTARKSARRDS